MLVNTFYIKSNIFNMLLIFCLWCGTLEVVMDLQKDPLKRTGKGRRLGSACLLILAILAGLYIQNQDTHKIDQPPSNSDSAPTVEATNEDFTQYKTALEALEAISAKGRAPKTGYTRAQFGNGWGKSGACDTRNRILARDLTQVTYELNSCVVLSGTLNDPYTGKVIPFNRGSGSSSAVQIDHVVALSDAWQKGAQQLTPALRTKFANDGLNLLAVDGPANQNKSDGDAATWLPSNKAMRCSYVARQVAVKLKYSLWMTSAEKSAIENVLKNCPEQPLSN